MATKKPIRLLSCCLPVALYACGMGAQQLSMPTDTLPTGLPKQPAETPTPPRVSCQDNRLTIIADNSTLGSILAAVHTCIGIEIKMPDGTADGRSYVHLGPGPIREVLDELLSSTEFNYAIQSSPLAPEGVLGILLIAPTQDTNDGQGGRGAPLAGDANMSPARRAWLASVQTARHSISPTDDDRASRVAVEPVPPSTADGLAPTPVNLGGVAPEVSASDSTQPAKEFDSSASASATVVPEAATPPDSVHASASSDQSQASPGAVDLRDKIDNMQQLFQQRQKMMANPSANPPQK